MLGCERERGLECLCGGSQIVLFELKLSETAPNSATLGVLLSQDAIQHLDRPHQRGFGLLILSKRLLRAPEPYEHVAELRSFLLSLVESRNCPRRIGDRVQGPL